MPVYPSSAASPSPTQVNLERRSPLTFVSLVFGLSLPFWWLGARSDTQFLPGLPLSALGFVCPALAATALVYREEGGAGVRALLKNALDYRRISPRRWYAASLLLAPGVMLATYGVMRALNCPLPPPQVSVLSALALSAVFFLPALAEELGWSAYALDPLQARWGAFPTAVVLGAVWGVWHFIPLIQANREPGWIAAWFLTTVALRVLIVWLYNNTHGSILAAALCHAGYNVSWQLFPNSGSHYDPRIYGPLIALVAVAVTVLWGPRTLAQYR